jgi:pimeloyl-ACP methyl ester carboxylesterase
MASLGTKHRVLAPDGRGHGRSGCPSELTEYRIQRLVADVLAVADHFSADRFALVGHDWGGIIAWCAAAWHPDRISHLITLNAPHPTLLQAGLDRDADQQVASSYIAALTAPDVEELLTPSRLWELVFASDEARGLIGPAEKADLLASWNRPGAIAGMLNWYRRWSSGEWTTRSCCRPCSRVWTTSCPTSRCERSMEPGMESFASGRNS